MPKAIAATAAPITAKSMLRANGDFALVGSRVAVVLECVAACLRCLADMMIGSC
jgi:hypothetical protein